ncbi:MAG: demethylmenaquinone methyltransferase [Eubacteriales bacterium]
MAAGFLELIRLDLNSVDQKIEKALKIKPGHLSKFAHFDLESLQKYLHPALVLFSGRLFKYSGEKLIYLASVIQLIYQASSIHLRIPDERVQPVAGLDPRDGAQFPVLVGDYLYGWYFTGLCEGQILEFLSPLSNIIAEINHGALLRKKNANRLMADVNLAMTVIEKETALLTEGSARIAGMLAGAPQVEVTRLADFGRNFGMAYGILERSLDPVMAGPYFDKARKALEELPEGEGRDGLEELLVIIQNGELPVPAKKIGRSQDPDQRQIGDMIVPVEYKDKEEYVHSIFSAIAKKYDTLNTVLSLNQDKYWRKFTVEQTGLETGGTVLDVCCGTGMITRELAKKVGPTGKVVGLDFCQEMLDIAKEALKGSSYENNVEYVQGNAMELPFPDNTFDSATIGFGLRNVPDMPKTVREMARVVKPGGRVVCLEFSKPTVPVFKQVYNFYFNKWVPFLGKLGVGTEGPYRYLHNSWKAFPHQKELRDEFTRQGLQEATFYELTGGVVSVHLGVKPLAASVSSVAATKE